MGIKMPSKFNHMMRLMNTNIGGDRKITHALSKIKGIGARFAKVVCLKANVDLDKRAGELTNDEIDAIGSVIERPMEYKIPKWFLNSQNEFKDNTSTQICANQLDSKLREDIARLKKIKSHRGMRHFWKLRVRGQHTKSTGRTGKTMGVTKKK